MLEVGEDGVVVAAVDAFAHSALLYRLSEERVNGMLAELGVVVDGVLP